MLRALVCCFLLLSSLDGFSADAGLRKPAGILYAAAHTKLNGAIVPGNLPVFEEDTVESFGTENAFVSLNDAKSSVRVIGNASVTLHDGWVYLRSGIASVSTNTQYMLKNDCLSVRPESTAQTQFTVTPYDGRMYVYAEKGALRVKSRRELRVAEGKIIAISNCGKPSEVIAFAGPNTVPKVVMGSMAAWGVSIGLLIGKMSGERPDERSSHP